VGAGQPLWLTDGEDRSVAPTFVPDLHQRPGERLAG
jgi:hypothetical protein